jgi:hypothetical protein
MLEADRPVEANDKPIHDQVSRLALCPTAVAHQSYCHPYPETGVKAYRAKAADEACQKGSFWALQLIKLLV